MAVPLSNLDLAVTCPVSQTQDLFCGENTVFCATQHVEPLLQI